MLYLKMLKHISANLLGVEMVNGTCKYYRYPKRWQIVHGKGKHLTVNLIGGRDGKWEKAMLGTTLSGGPYTKVILVYI